MQSSQARQRLVVVTGASAGVGRAIAVELGRRGNRVALLARGHEGLEAAAWDVAAAGGTVWTRSLDVSDANAVEAAAASIEDEFGQIDAWINTAFAGTFGFTWDVTPDEFRRVTEVTYWGYVYGTLAALRRMRERQRGTIVQVGSALAYRGIPLQAPYCGAKHAIQGFHDSLRTELLHERSKVRVTMVQLPAVNTPQFGWVKSYLGRRPRPVAPIYQPEVAARAVCWALDHPRRRERWVGSSTALTIAVNAVAPGVLDRYLARRGIRAQLTDRFDIGDFDGNLWTPRDSGEDAGAHGAFDDEARSHSAQQGFARHSRLVGLAGVGAAVATVATSRMRRVRR
ncbi:MAG: SDR family oxidoreductase [Marmoricola sp.]